MIDTGNTGKEAINYNRVQNGLYFNLLFTIVIYK